MEKTFPKLKPEDLTKEEFLGLLGLFEEEGYLAIERDGILYEISKKELKDFYETKHINIKKQ